MNFVICCTLIVAACSLGAVASDQVQCYSADQSTGQTKRIYTIAHGLDWGAYDYLNDGGQPTGFIHDLIDEVCAAADIDCRTVWDPFFNCVKSTAGQHTRPGVGLMDRWYDACTGWAATTARMAFFKFSASFLQVAKAAFFVKSDGSNFNSDKYWEANKIGFIQGWKDDEQCLARFYGKALRADQIVHYVTTSEINAALVAGEITAAFLTKDTMNAFITGDNPPLKMLNQDISCVIRGNAMMTRKDSDFIVKWNEGFTKLISNGRFAKLCAEANSTHNADGKGVIECV